MSNVFNLYESHIYMYSKNETIVTYTLLSSINNLCFTSESFTVFYNDILE